jgi:hypothetical protein
VTTRLAFKDDEAIVLRGVEREIRRDKDEQLKQRDETIENLKSDQGSVRKLIKQKAGCSSDKAACEDNRRSRMVVSGGH